MKARLPLSLAAICLSATLPLLAQNSTPLFDGASLEGWEFTPGVWRIEDGAVTAGTGKDKIPRNEFISTKKSYENFDLTLKIQCAGDPATGLINSGIQIRSARLPGGSMAGYQVDCGAGWFGKIYDEHRRALIYGKPVDAAALEKAVDVFGWNEYRILAEGLRIQVWINGVKASDFTETNPDIPLNGAIGPQIHSGGHAIVRFKDIVIRELPATPGAPSWESLGGVEAALKKAKQQQPAPPAAKPIKAGNASVGEPRSAAEQLKAFHLPEGYEIELVVQESEGIGKFVSVYFDHRGRLWTQTALEYPIDANENPAAAEAVYAGKGKDKVLVYPRESLNGKIPAGGLTNPTVFADGLAIPLGILPWGNGDTCYVQHGHDLKLYKDTNGDGRADTFEVILTGFGVQDSHLFPHQFTRAPGGWIWMAQGLFNNSQVRKPGSDVVVDWPKCSMARMRPDGSDFEVTSTGPNNIWGLVITSEGETFIQEANDYGYPIMPFHEYAYYPGGMEALKKTYQPGFPPQAEFRMGGTGLSGLALIESGPLKDQQATHTMAVANPITSKIQTLAMHRDDAWWKLSQLPDLLTCDDPFFRPVGLTNGPDGCLYIVDWYNKIISHNEVPRTHPDRDKTRGRIWRVKPVGEASPTPDFTKLSTEELIARLGKEPLGSGHLAWQELLDRKELPPAHFAAHEYQAGTKFGQISQIGRSLSDQNIQELLSHAQPSLPNPATIASTRGAKQIPVREAYDREFERFLVRMFLERQPGMVAKFLDSEAAAKLPIEALVLASLALEPKASASRVAKLLPQLDRAPNDEELLRLAQFPAEAGVGESLRSLLTHEKSRAVVAEKLLAQRTKLDANQIAPLLGETAKQMLQTSPEFALQLISGFQLTNLESDLVALAKSGTGHSRALLLTTLRDLRSAEADFFASLAQSGPDPLTRDAALEALAASRAPDAGTKLLALYPSLQPAPRRRALTALSSTKAGALSIVSAVIDKTLPATDLDGPTVERLATILGDDPALTPFQEQLGGIFREVLAFDGQETAWTDSLITLEGPFTVETWVRLAPGISNQDAILGAPGGPEMNFFASTFRVFAGPELRDVCVTTKPMTPDLWTHLAVTRDAQGICRIYQNGELDATGTKPTPAKWENCRIGWSGPKGGTEGLMTEFRVWNRERTAAEIRNNFDRVIPSAEGMKRYDQAAGTLGKGARIAKTIDTPPLLTVEQASKLDADFARLEALAKRGGDPAKGQALAGLCTSCHLIHGTGGQLGPDLSGIGSMGLEAILRHILTPNAAMEAGYRIYRVEMKNGDLIDAFFVNENEEAVVIRQPGAADRRIPRAGIESTRFIRRSLMPEGLLSGLDDANAANLLAYLLSLK